LAKQSLGPHLRHKDKHIPQKYNRKKAKFILAGHRMEFRAFFLFRMGGGARIYVIFVFY
jgi:hypothetical protein